MQVHIANGDPSKRGVGKLQERLNNQIIAEKGLPDCPAHLEGRAREAWDFWKQSLEGMNLDYRPDAQMLEMACMNYQTATEAFIQFQQEGLRLTIPIYNKQGGHVRDTEIANPLIAIHNAAAKNMRAFCAEFGLSPVSRTRLSFEKKNEAEDELHDLLSKPRDKKEALQ